MSQRAIEFVNEWCATNLPPTTQAEVEALLDEEAGDPRPAVFARRCQLAADAAGIAREEIGREVGDLESFMARALDRMTRNEDDRGGRGL